MLSEEQIRSQILKFLSDKKLSDKERAAFLLATIDVVRKKFALEVEQSLKEKDFKEIENIPSDERAMEEMLRRWEAHTGKKTKDRLQEIILDFFDKFLKVKDQLAPAQQEPPASVPQSN